MYLKKALETIADSKIVHVALSIEGKRPYFQKKIESMRLKIAALLQIEVEKVGITATSGDGLTDFGCGVGVQCLCILTISKYL